MKFGYTSWLPQTELVNSFVEQLKNGKLMGTRCKRCGLRYLPPRAHCKCGRVEMEWFEAPRQGRLLSYTMVTFAPESMSKYSPYIVAVVELEGGLSLLAQLTGVGPSSLKVGLPVQVASHQVSEDRVVYKFKPI